MLNLVKICYLKAERTKWQLLILAVYLVSVYLPGSAVILMRNLEGTQKQLSSLCAVVSPQNWADILTIWLITKAEKNKSKNKP